MIQSLSSTASSAEVVEVLNRDGCVVVKSLADLKLCDRLAEELTPFLDAKKDEPPINAPYGYEDFLPVKTRRIVGVIAKSRAYRALVSHPLIMSVCDAMLLPSCASYQLCTTAALVTDPGSKAQALHREDQLWNLPSPHPVIEVASMWAITYFTRENGATHLVPGSNLWWDDRTPRSDEIVQAEMARGSLLLWTDHVLHGAGANQSNAPRVEQGDRLEDLRRSPAQIPPVIRVRHVPVLRVHIDGDLPRQLPVPAEEVKRGATCPWG